jgi:hypothetical protein
VRKKAAGSVTQCGSKNYSLGGSAKWAYDSLTFERIYEEGIMNTVADRTATIWTDGVLPLRMYWRDRRWRVTDTPTALFGEPEYSHPLLTHSPSVRIGWRFQVTDDDGESVVVDAVKVESEWVIVRTYQ